MAMFIFHWLILALSSLDVILVIDAKANDGIKVANDDYNGVVLNMIRTWESPVVYLTDRGFLPSDYQDTSRVKPSLDALMQRLERDKRADQNDLDEGKPDQQIGSVPSVSRQKKSNGWEHLEVISNMLKGHTDKLGGLESPLLAMKRRFEQFHTGDSCSTQTAEMQKNANEAPALTPKESQNYDEVLQRMIEKTSPQKACLHSPKVNAPNADSISASGVVPASKDNHPVTPVPTILSSYEAHRPLNNPIDNPQMKMLSRLMPQGGMGKLAVPSLRPALEAPKYLNWDMKNGRLDQYSRSELDAYLEKLLRAYRSKLVSRQSPKSPQSTQ